MNKLAKGIFSRVYAATNAKIKQWFLVLQFHLTRRRTELRFRPKTATRSPYARLNAHEERIASVNSRRTNGRVTPWLSSPREDVAKEPETIRYHTRGTLVEKRVTVIPKSVRNCGANGNSAAGGNYPYEMNLSTTTPSDLDAMNLYHLKFTPTLDARNKLPPASHAPGCGPSLVAILVPSHFLSDLKRQRERVVALDCEMVMLEDNSRGLAQCSIVNYQGRILYNEYIKPEGDLAQCMWRKRLEERNVTCPPIPFEQAVGEIKKLVAGKIVVGHDLNHDFRALQFSHPSLDIRDTSTCRHLQVGLNGNVNCKTSLKTLADHFLNYRIQKKHHCSLEDTRAIMKLYKIVEIPWEWEIKQR